MEDFQKRMTKALKQKNTRDKYGNYSNKHLRILEELNKNKSLITTRDS